MLIDGLGSFYRSIFNGRIKFYADFDIYCFNLESFKIKSDIWSLDRRQFGHKLLKTT